MSELPEPQLPAKKKASGEILRLVKEIYRMLRYQERRLEDLETRIESLRREVLARPAEEVRGLDDDHDAAPLVDGAVLGLVRSWRVDLEASRDGEPVADSPLEALIESLKKEEEFLSQPDGVDSANERDALIRIVNALDRARGEDLDGLRDIRDRSLEELKHNYDCRPDDRIVEGRSYDLDLGNRFDVLRRVPSALPQGVVTLIVRRCFLGEDGRVVQKGAVMASQGTMRG